MDRYSAVEYRLDCLVFRTPSLEETVFCRETGRWVEEEDVETRESCGITAVAMLTVYRLYPAGAKMLPVCLRCAKG